MSAAPPTHRLLSVRLHNATYDDLLAVAAEAAAAPLPAHTAYAHFHILLDAREQPRLRSLLNEAALVVTDGVAVRAALRLNGARGCLPINATDFHHRLLDRALAARQRVYLLGGSPEAAAALPGILARRSPGCAVRVHHGHIAVDDRAVLDDILAFGPDLLLLGMGSPLQFDWIARNLDIVRVPLTAATGNFLEFLSGRRPRAPRWLRVLRLEWLHRLTHEPARLWRRYLLGIPRFALAVLKEHRSSPGS